MLQRNVCDVRIEYNKIYNEIIDQSDSMINIKT